MNTFVGIMVGGRNSFHNNVNFFVEETLIRVVSRVILKVLREQHRAHAQ